MILLKCSFNYADEFDCEFFNIVTEEWWDKFKIDIKKARYPIECYFGTNEGLTFDSYEDILLGITIIPITDKEHKIITKHLGDSFGTASGAIEDISDQANNK